MKWAAFAAGAAIGLLHFTLFIQALKKLISKKVLDLKRGTLLMFACFRLLISAALGLTAILYFHLDAAWLAAGLIAGYMSGQVSLMKNSK